MFTTIPTLLAALVLGLVVFLRRGVPKPALIGASIWLVRAGLVVLGLYTAFFLLFGIGESLGGEPGGWGHFIQALGPLALLLLARQRPLEGGIVLTAVGLLMLLFVPGFDDSQGWRFDPISYVFIGLPYLISGILFLIAGVQNRKQLTTAL